MNRPRVDRGFVELRANTALTLERRQRMSTVPELERGRRDSNAESTDVRRQSVPSSKRDRRPVIASVRRQVGGAGESDLAHARREKPAAKGETVDHRSGSGEGTGVAFGDGSMAGLGGTTKGCPATVASGFMTGCMTPRTLHSEVVRSVMSAQKPIAALDDDRSSLAATVSRSSRWLCDRLQEESRNSPLT